MEAAVTGGRDSRHRGESHQVRDRENGRSVSPGRSTSAEGLAIESGGPSRTRTCDLLDSRPSGQRMASSSSSTRGCNPSADVRCARISWCALVSFIVIGSLLAVPLSQSEPTTGPPCVNQSRTFAELRRAFVQGRLPSPIDTTGMWVAIGFFGDAESHGKDLAHLNCAGLKRGAKYEQGMVIVGYSIETHFVGTLDRGPFSNLTVPVASFFQSTSAATPAPSIGAAPPKTHWRVSSKCIARVWSSEKCRSIRATSTRANRLLVDGSNAWHGSSGVGRGIAGRVLSDRAAVLNRYTPFFVGGSTKLGVG